MGLRALIRKKKRSRGVLGVSDVHVPYVLQRNFLASAPHQKWVTDITEFSARGHKLYLSACMDLYNGEIIAIAWPGVPCSTWSLAHSAQRFRGPGIPAR